MFDLSVFIGMTQKEKYENMLLMLKGILQGEKDVITNLSNASAVINALSEDVSWCGFYLLKEGELVLGPFQGLPACTRIPIGKGVCGTAAEKMETIIVEDVNSFEGHIACDAASNSEIVLPIIINNSIYGVLDIDSTSIARFDEEDKYYLEKAVEIIKENL
ncbi:GAF domain-containing protein [Clostridium polynesiense]|uniref:GAF domain-containing protein n=1 Tax=Clostridium polynesiense TaxID=1325933 RepID=UPI0005910574|nr:GAF domain-containing protein [Clostridium polynesiense]